VPEDLRSRLSDPPPQTLRPDQPPQPSTDELAAIRALFNGNATKAQQAQFVGYLLRMCGEGQVEFGQGEFWAFMGGRRWVTSTLMTLAGVRMVPAGVKKILETETDD
jgi:hypothetical protein